ncbi:unnamed protein product [Adineta steineri]|uniref:Uncharacterized protein n=2 Tax=Adineta steineri TaxID=433720 RepID=A0A819E1T1_9BILA|nr:unnamed protein product [Adineta steineri]CAF3842829.1 unnamed protein product [Adineta steineri]
MYQTEQIPNNNNNNNPKTMSDSSRPTSRWSSSRFTATTSRSNNSNNQITPFFVSRKKLFQPIRNNQQSFANLTKTKDEMEEIFKTYYSNNTRLDPFKETVIGTRISSPRTPIPVPNRTSTDTPPDIFRSRHCVSREDMSPLDIHGENQIVIDDNPIVIKSIKIRSSPVVVEPTISTNSSLTALKNLLSVKSNNTISHDITSNSLEHKNMKRSKSAYRQRPISSTTTLNSNPIGIYSLANNRKDPLNFSYSSQEQNQPHILTGTAMTANQRLPTRSARQNQRPKSNTTIPENIFYQQSSIKQNRSSREYDMSQSSAHIITQSVASIPSKCSRYVLITFPKVQTRYNIPTCVERLLLPERFPILYQNILHSSDRNQNNK